MELAVFGPAVEELLELDALIRAKVKDAIVAMVRSGEILTQVKEASKHGEWLPWLEKNVPFSQATAWRYMEVYRRRGELFTMNNLGGITAKALMSGRNGETPREPAKLHESNFYSQSIRLTQRLMGDINHELKDRPIDSWGKENWITLAAALEPLAELYQRLKSLLA